MVKFTPRIVSSGLVATVVLGGLVSAENCSVAAVPTSMPLGNQTTVRDSWKRRTQSLAQSWFKVKTPQQSKRELAEYTEAIRLNPKNADAYLKRGNLRSGLLTILKPFGSNPKMHVLIRGVLILGYSMTIGVRSLIIPKSFDSNLKMQVLIVGVG
jgi:hypothetical protein